MSAQDPRNGNIPTLPGFIDRHTEGVAGPPAMLLMVWCRWCCRWHEHGAADYKPGDTTHRIAHCYAPDSTYDDTGYNILISDKPFTEVRGSVRQASGVQRAAIGSGRISAAVQLLRDQPQPIG